MNLTHFTKTATALENILDHGFAWIRNDRKVISDLLPEVDFSEREPQSFGQICFTENTRESSIDHVEKYGTFGIEVNWEWAKRNLIQPVIYVPKEGPLLDSLRFLFTQTYNKSKIEEKYPGDKARQMWESNAAMASVVASPLYARLLKLYEYMEPANHSHEREWRITNQNPNYSISSNLQKTINDVSPPLNWATIINVVKIEPQDIIKISCKKENYSELKDRVPLRFKDVPIQQA